MVTMTEQQVVKQFLMGLPVMVVEYRSSRIDPIQWRDKATGQRREAVLLKHTVEAGDRSFVVNERMPDDWDATKYVSPNKKGQRMVLEFTDFKTERGRSEASGKLIPLDVTPKPS